MSLKIVRDGSVADFLEAVGPLLYREEPKHSLMLGLCEDLVAKSERDRELLLLRIEAEGKTVSAALRTNSNLVLSAIDSAAISALVDCLSTLEIDIPGVIGPAASTAAFAKSWAAKTGRRRRVAMEQWIYELRRVIWPSGIAGALRPAAGEDTALVAKWFAEFAAEATPQGKKASDEAMRTAAETAVQQGVVFLWESEGVAVSMAKASRPTKNGTTVNAVYTPPELRKRGHASATVAALSQSLLDSGKQFCVLYTDAANPTSNRIYRSVGYELVGDSRHYLFENGEG